MPEIHCNKLEKSLHFYGGILEKFVKNFRSIHSIREFMSVKQEKETTIRGSQNQSLQTPSGLHYTVYYRNLYNAVNEERKRYGREQNIVFFRWSWQYLKLF